ncbi:hypothetical protein F5884DRAFT_829333 [Xylogone sp. PMI_703]|nr:hypothetical protein F5884DRAFT_829333 [Xylogone sp. PMI_703]
MPPNGPRPEVIGLETGPEAPYPLRMKGKVVSGFGRGSKDLGIPTANIPVDNVSWIETAPSGVYFGWAGIQLPPSHPDLSAPPSPPPSTSAARPDTSPSSTTVVPHDRVEAGWRLFPMVMSIGYNPFYKNTVRSAEVHVLHKFSKDFYGSEMAISILGYIRPEFDYVDVESLIKDIETDIEVAKRSLGREKWGWEGEGKWLWGEEE